MSTDKRVRDLIHRDLDGELTPIEKNELNRVLDTDQTAKRLYAELQNAHAVMSSLPEVNPLRDMKIAVMSQIKPWPKPRPTWASRAVQALRTFGEQFRIRPAIPFAVGVAAGLAVFAVYIGTADQTALPGDSHYAATLIAPAPDQKPDFLQQFELPKASGTITVTHSQGIAWLSFRTTAHGKTTIELSYEPDQLIVRHIDQQNTIEASMNQARGSITIVQSGPSEIQLGFTGSGPQTSAVKVSVTAGTDQYQDAIALGVDPASAGDHHPASD